MSIGYLVAVIFTFAIGVWVADLWKRRCRRYGDIHNTGVPEGWVTVFGLNFLLLYFVMGNRHGNWVLGVIGAALLLFVVRGFWLNWEHKA